MGGATLVEERNVSEEEEEEDEDDEEEEDEKEDEEEDEDGIRTSSFSNRSFGRLDISMMRLSWNSIALLNEIL